MSAEIINLRKARKAKARADKEKISGQNRRKFGRTKAERAKAEADEDLATRRLEAHRRGPGDDERDP
jgi:hypothetical protein